MSKYRFLHPICLTLLFLYAITACKQGPNITEPLPIESSLASSNENVVSEVREITVVEAIPSIKYLYIQAKENNRNYWIATGPTEVEVGAKYYYNEALIMYNFESQEMERIFDTIYLVTQLVPESHGKALTINNPKDFKTVNKSGENDEEVSNDNTPVNKVTKISIVQLLADPGKFKNQTVEISGTCTKINMGIMGKNWIHLKDHKNREGSVVVTSEESAAPGDTLTIQAQVSLNRDFGAGYRYDILLENGILIE